MVGMKKIIIWDTGFYGQYTYYKMKSLFEILYFVDNKEISNETELFGIPVISEKKLKDVYTSEMDIVISNENYFEISSRLIAMGIREYYVMMEGLLYDNSANGTMIPIEFSRYPYLSKKKEEKNILFIQNIVCARTHKIAKLVKTLGYKVYLLSMIKTSEIEDKDISYIYDGIYTFYTADGIVNFIENSDFDMIHSICDSNILTNTVLLTTKPIIFDSYKKRELWESDSVENRVLEYLANTQCDGNIYSSQDAAKIAKENYGLEDKEILIWDTNNSIKELVSFYQRIRKRKVTR